MRLGEAGHADGQLWLTRADVADQVGGVREYGEQLLVRAGETGGPVAAQGEHVVDAQGADRFEKTVDLGAVGGHPGEMRHDLEAAGVDEPFADLQGVVLGGAAGAVGHRGEQRPQLAELPGRVDKGRPLVPIFRGKEFERDKRPPAGDQLRNLHTFPRCAFMAPGRAGLSVSWSCGRPTGDPGRNGPATTPRDRTGRTPRRSQAARAESGRPCNTA